MTRVERAGTRTLGRRAGLTLGEMEWPLAPQPRGPSCWPHTRCGWPTPAGRGWTLRPWPWGSWPPCWRCGPCAGGRPPAPLLPLLLAGALAGLAVGTKYVALLALPAALVPFAAAAPRRLRPGPRRAPGRRPALSAGGGNRLLGHQPGPLSRPAGRPPRQPGLPHHPGGGDALALPRVPVPGPGGGRGDRPRGVAAGLPGRGGPDPPRAPPSRVRTGRRRWPWAPWPACWL